MSLKSTTTRIEFLNRRISDLTRDAEEVYLEHIPGGGEKFRRLNLQAQPLIKIRQRLLDKKERIENRMPITSNKFEGME